MKGSNKQFARYLDSEYEDYALEPLEKEEEKTNINSLLKNSSNTTQNNPTEIKERSGSPKVLQLVNSTIPLTQDVIRNFATLLGPEALEYVDGLKHIERVNNEVFAVYKGLYMKFQTVPILFFSHVPGKAVYVWQVNRVCPYRKSSNFMVLDTQSLGFDVTPTISIMMLAKIIPEEGEEILDGGFLAGGQFSAQSRIGKEQLVIRQYRLVDLVELARVNPFKQEILANNKHYCRLVVKGTQTTIEAKERLEISLWKRKTNEEIERELAEMPKDEQAGEVKPIVREKLVQRNTNWEFNILSVTSSYGLGGFGRVYGTQNNVSIIFDSFTKTVIAWREDAILVSSYQTDRVSTFKVEKDSLFLKTSQTEMWQITFETFPNVEAINLAIDHGIFSEWYGWGKEIVFQPSSGFSTTSKMVYKDNQNPIYDVPTSVINPHFKANLNGQKNVEKDNAKEDKNEEEKQEETPLKSLDQIKSEVRQKKNEKADHKTNLKSAKASLQDVRADIKAQMTGASKEAIELYNEIKTEKKRMERQREKEKAKRKDKRSKDDDF